MDDAFQPADSLWPLGRSICDGGAAWDPLPTSRMDNRCVPGREVARDATNGWLRIEVLLPDDAGRELLATAASSCVPRWLATSHL